MHDHKDAYTILEEEYERKLAKIRDEAMRTWTDCEEAYENCRSNYIIERTILETNRTINEQRSDGDS